MRIGYKLFLGFLIVGLSVSIAEYSSVSYAFNELYSDSIPALNSVNSMEKNLLDIVIEVSAYIDTGEKEHKEKIYKDIRDYDANLESYKKTNGAQDKTLLQILEPSNDSFIGLTKELVSSKDQGMEKSLLEERVSTELRIKEEEMLIVLNKAKDISEKEMNQEVKDVIDALFLAIGLSFALALGMGYILLFSISKPIINLRGVTREIAKGNFAARIEVEPSDEIGELGEAFNKMACDLQKSSNKRVKAEEELLKFKLGIERADEVFFMTDTDGTMVYVNPAFKRTYGFEKEEALGKTPRILKSGAVSPEIYRQFWDALLSRKVMSGEIVNKTKDGRLLNVESSSVPILNDEGNIIGFLAIQRDITEKKNIEKIRLENEQLAYASKAKSDFLANMSHELRTPLNSIIGFSELMKKRIAGELNDKQEHYMDNILMSSQFLLSLINDILDLSKVEAGKIELVIEEMSVAETINETIMLIKERATKHNVLIKKEFDSDLRFIKADKQRFKQVLFNLMSNAVKFSKPEGGVITIRTKKEGDMAGISITDTGIGIKEEDLGRLFEEFEQLDSGISRKYGGTGLGLAISKKLIDLHGGKFSVESRYGEGSTFTFFLPIEAKADESE